MIPGLDVGASFRPSGGGDEIGGDFYDFFELADGAWVVGIGDVCGKGVEAAVVAGLARHTIRAAAVRDRRLDAILRVLNDALLLHGGDRHLTVALALLVQTEEGWSVRFCSGGHPLPLASASRWRRSSRWGRPVR